MSAHYGAPGLRRPQLATPSFTASTQTSAIHAPSGVGPRMRRKALFVAAATLCAPALAALALAALAATGGGDRAAMGSLTGTHGLRGTTTPSVTESPTANTHQGTAPVESLDSSRTPATRRPQGDPATKPAHRAPAHRPAPAPPKVSPAPHSHLNTPSLPTYDPSGPGAPTTSTSGSTSGTGGSSGSGTVTPSGTGSGTGSGNASGTGSDSHGGSGAANPDDAYSGGA